MLVDVAARWRRRVPSLEVAAASCRTPNRHRRTARETHTRAGWRLPCARLASRAVAQRRRHRHLAGGA